MEIDLCGTASKIKNKRAKIRTKLILLVTLVRGGGVHLELRGVVVFVRTESKRKHIRDFAQFKNFVNNIELVSDCLSNMHFLLRHGEVSFVHWQ